MSDPKKKNAVRSSDGKPNPDSSNICIFGAVGGTSITSRAGPKPEARAFSLVEGDPIVLPPTYKAPSNLYELPKKKKPRADGLCFTRDKMNQARNLRQDLEFLKNKHKDFLPFLPNLQEEISEGIKAAVGLERSLEDSYEEEKKKKYFQELAFRETELVKMLVYELEGIAALKKELRLYTACIKQLRDMQVEPHRYSFELLDKANAQIKAAEKRKKYF